MYFSRSSTRFSGFFSAMAVLNALASSGSSCGVSAGFWVAAASRLVRRLGVGRLLRGALSAGHGHREGDERQQRQGESKGVFHSNS